MVHNNKEVLEYWNQDQVESMYDKHLINLEIELIRKRIENGSKILDAGCGEGEGTIVYSSIPGTTVHAADFSETRLKKAKERLTGKTNVTLQQVDFLGEYELDKDYDFIVSQRFLINLMEWDLQKKVILDLMRMLKQGGTLLLLEGCMDGVKELNDFRGIYGLPAIPVKWHNLFFDNAMLVNLMKENKYELKGEEGLGEYFLLTRGIRPIFDSNLKWDSEFNRISSGQEVKDILRMSSRFSRLKLWVFQKSQA
jgi:SAM-dependent methyltransferase